MNKKYIDQDYCINDYWLDYPRKDKVKINNLNISESKKEKIRKGESVSDIDRGGSYRQYYHPIIYNDLRD